MKIIDARSGKQVRPGETVIYDSAVWAVGPGGSLRQGPSRGKEGFIFHGLLKRKVRGGVVGDFTMYEPGYAPRRVEVPMPVRYTHPSFFLQKVAFIPS